MASTYTANVGIEKIGAGEQAGTWGSTTNTNFDIVDRAINGVGAINLGSAATYNLTTSDGTLSEGHYKVLVFSSANSSGTTVKIGGTDDYTQDKIFYIVNSSGYTLTFSQGVWNGSDSGRAVEVANNAGAIIYADGGGSGAIVKQLQTLVNTNTISGDLEFDVSGDIILDADGNDVKIQNGAGADEVTITLADDTAFTIATPGDCTIDAVGDIVLDADGNDVNIKNGAGGDTLNLTLADDANFTLTAPGDCTIDAVGDIVLDADGNDIQIKNGGGGDTATITLADDAAFTLAAPGDTTLDIVGDLNIDVDGGDIVFKDGGTTAGSLDIATADTIKFKAGTTEEMRLTTSGLAIENGIYVGDASTAPTDNEVRAQGDITAFHSSDRRLKENITPITDALNKVSKINGVEFDWTDEHIEKRGGEDGYFVRKHDVGVIAQEVLEVLPEVVREREDNTLAVDYERMVALLIEAVKDLKKEVEELKQK